MMPPAPEPLYSLEHEQEVIAQALAALAGGQQVCAALDDTDFGNPTLRKILPALRAVVKTGEPFPLLGIKQELEKRGQWDEVGGAAYVNEVLGEGFFKGKDDLAFYVEKVASDGSLRWLVDTCRSIASDCQRRNGTYDELKSRLIAALVGRVREHSRGPARFGEVLTEELQRIIEGRPVPAMQFGIDVLDRFCGGLERGEVGIITGKPGTGKTALVHQLAATGVEEWGAGMIFSLEVNRRHIVRRQLARVSGYSYRDIRTLTTWEPHIGTVCFDERDKGNVIAAAGRLQPLEETLWIEDSVTTLDRIIATAHEKHAETPLQWLAIDYGQLVEVRNAEKRNIEVEAVTRAAKNQLAGPLDLPVWMVSSLSKKGMDSKGADMNDLAESASLQYTAGLMLYLLADEKWPEGDPITGVLAHVIKSRNDATGIVPLLFNKPQFMLTGRDNEPPPPPVRRRLDLD